jgi:hypothetical protein
MVHGVCVTHRQHSVFVLIVANRAASTAPSGCDWY